MLVIEYAPEENEYNKSFLYCRNTNWYIWLCFYTFSTPVEDETFETIEYLLFEVYIGLESNDYNYNYYEDEDAVLDAADNFE